MNAININRGGLRYLIVAGLVIAAFFGAYRYAAARTGAASDVSNGASGKTSSVTDANGASTPGCACCGTAAPTKDGITGDPVEGTAAFEDGVQRLTVDLSKGYYDPNVIVLKAGAPAEITFGQSSGCTAQVVSSDLGFSEDLTAGPRVVSLPALEPGDYTFSCGMQMVFGKIVVK